MSARDRRKGRSDLRRRPAEKKERATVHVFLEGEATEHEYVYALSREPEFRDVVHVVYEREGAVPKTLIDAACQTKSRAALETDSYWCVFDVESPADKQHPGLRESVGKAHDNGIKVAMSNPCFELWLILHHQNQTGFLTTDAAQHLRNSLDGDSGKHLDGKVYMPLRQGAVDRARALRRKHEGDGTAFPADNPSTGFDLFVDEFSEFATAVSEADQDANGSGEERSVTARRR